MRQPTAEDWERIEAAIGLDYDEQRRRKLLATFERLFDHALKPPPWADQDGCVAPPPEYRRAYVALKRQAEKTMKAAGRNWRAESLKSFIANLDDVAPDQDEGGRPPNWQLQGGIYSLGCIYFQLTGQKPRTSRNTRGEPTGPFFDFASSCIRACAPELLQPGKSDEALYSAMVRAREMRIRPTI